MEEFNLNDLEHEKLCELISKQGIIFEGHVHRDLEEIFAKPFKRDPWTIRSSVCFREHPMDRDFDGRLELDFVVEPVELWSPKEDLICSEEEGLFNPVFLVEAKSSKFSCCFFDLLGNGCAKEQSVSFLNCGTKGHRFFKKNVKTVVAKRDLAIEIVESGKGDQKKKTFAIPGKKFDMIHSASRQLIKNLQAYLRDLPLEGEVTVLPIIVTNAPLFVFGDIYSEVSRQPEFSLKKCFQHPFVCFEFEDFLFADDQKIKTLDSLCTPHLEAVISVWVVQRPHLKALLKTLLPKGVLPNQIGVLNSLTKAGSISFSAEMKEIIEKFSVQIRGSNFFLRETPHLIS